MTRILTIALVAMLTMTANSYAEKPEGKPRPGQAGKGAGGPRGAAGGARDPEQMVARMMETFDKDGDQKLDVAELTAMLTSMRERRGQAMAGRGGQAGQPGAAQRRRPGAAGKPGGEGKAGGERPKRPAAEK